MISVRLQGKPFKIMVIQVYAPNSNAEEAEVERFALETNRDHSVVFEIASKYCISDSFVDHDGYSISSEGFLPTIVDIMRMGNGKPLQYSCLENPMKRQNAGY